MYRQLNCLYMPWMQEISTNRAKEIHWWDTVLVKKQSLLVSVKLIYSGPSLSTPAFLWLDMDIWSKQYYWLKIYNRHHWFFYLLEIDSATIRQLLSHSLVLKYEMSEFRQSPKISSSPSSRRSKKSEITITRTSSASAGEKTECIFLYNK